MQRQLKDRPKEKCATTMGENEKVAGRVKKKKGGLEKGFDELVSS